MLELMQQELVLLVEEVGMNNFFLKAVLPNPKH
jgi:hypothetical protein